MTELLTDIWYFAATSAELKPGEMFRREIMNEPVLLGRTKEGEAFALRDICPHRAVPLSAGKQVNQDGATTVECPYHGWRFGLDGACRHMPSLVPGQLFEVGKIRVRRFPVREQFGMVFAFFAADARALAEPSIEPPDFGMLPPHPKFVVESLFNANMDNAVVGLMDPAHVGFVHTQWWWRPPSAGFKIKEKEFEPYRRGWRIKRHAPSSNSKLYRWVFGAQVMTEILFELPGYRWEVVESDDGLRLVTISCLTPINNETTRVTQLTYFMGAPILNLAIPFASRMAKAFLEQDRHMVDLQNEGLKYHPGMLWVDDIDMQAKWYLRLKREWAASRTDARGFVNPLTPATLRWRS